MGWAYGKHQFMAEGVQIAIQALQDMQLDILAFLPVNYLHAKTYAQSTHHVVLQSLISQNIVSLVPSGESDDAYILNYARAHNAFIISNDMYRDHLQSIHSKSIYTSMCIWLEENRCGYLFAQNNFVLNPTSALSFALHKKTIQTQHTYAHTQAHGQRHTHTQHTLTHAHTHSRNQLVQTSFEVIIQELIHKNRPHLLEHILLTRAFLALEVSIIDHTPYIIHYIPYTIRYLLCLHTGWGRQTR